MKVSIIVPVYNEENTIEEILHRINKVELKEIQKEIIVIDDGSSDKTVEILKKYPLEIKTIFMHSNSGKGTVVREGLKYVTGDIVIIQDADLELDPQNYIVLLEPIIKSKIDIVYGSRFLNSNVQIPFYSRLANIIMTLAANIIYGLAITDGACGYKVMKRESIEAMKLESKRFSLEAEIIAKAKKMGYTWCEVPVSFSRRGMGEGKKVKAWDGVEWLWELIKHKLRR